MLTGGKLSLRAIFGTTMIGSGLLISASEPATRTSTYPCGGQYGAGRFAEPSKPRCYPYPAVSRLCWV
jgi:hypothetical protein